MTRHRLTTRSSEWQKFRAQIIAKRGRICQMCGYHVPKPNPLILHHTSYPAVDTELNVILLCSSCHTKWHYPDNFEDAEKIKAFKQSLRFLSTS